MSVAAASAVITALASCGQARPAASSHQGRFSPQRNLATTPYSWSPFNRVNGLAAVSAHDIWAVGSAGTRPLVERWNGRAWKRVPIASPRGAQESLLTAVAATGPSDAWAVGYYNTGKTIKTLIERWNGHRWKHVASPSPGGRHNSYLLGVAATSSSNVWAVGEFTAGGKPKTLVERWNGRIWKHVTSPSPGGPHAYSELNGVAAAGKSSAWAVGYYFGPPVRPLIERWNGRAWKFVASPNPGGHSGGALNAVTTVGGAAVWAAGNAGTRTTTRPLIERWNGRAWKPVTSPEPRDSRGSNLTAIAAISPTRAWAVGYYFADVMVDPAALTFIERWNGRTWTQEPSPSPGGTVDSSGDQSLLQAVCAISSSQAWAAGSFSAGNPRGKFLIERRRGTSWTYLPVTQGWPQAR